MSDQAVVINALEEQVGHYRDLAKLAQIQHAHVQQNQSEALLEVLQRRQAVLDHIARLEQLISPAKRQWHSFVTGLPAARRERAEALLGETRRLLEEITAADRDDALVLQQRKLNLGRQIGQATAARTVNRTYAAAAYGPAAPKLNVRQ